MFHPTPAIVTRFAARRLPRWVLILLGLAYVVPGLLGRDPWRHNDLAVFGAMLDLAQYPQHWWQPQVLGQAVDTGAWLPYWLGAAAIRLLPFVPADQAMRLPFAGLLVLTLAGTWYATYHLARLPTAQPVHFAFGGEAQPADYARALADTALLALVASLGLGLLSHEAGPSSAQLACSALLLYACARLAQPADASRRFDTGAVLSWWCGAVGLALSGAPVVGATLGLGWLGWSAHALWRQREPASGQLWQGVTWIVCATGTLAAGALLWQADPARWVRIWHQLPQWAHWSTWQSYGELWLWFAWPAWPLALWTLWRWRHRLHSAHIALPLWFVAVATVWSWLLLGQDRALLLALPALACLAAFAVPTLQRHVTALMDWFALLFFSGCAAIIWLFWLAMQTGLPPKPAASVARLLPGFSAEFSGWQWWPALLATGLWLGLVAWRLGRHQPALWKSLALSAAGSVLCWLLLMTLWLPALNHGMGLAPIARRIAALAPPGTSCTLVHGLRASEITALHYHGGLALQRTGTAAPAHNGDGSCQLLVVAPQALATLAQVVHLPDWEVLSTVPRLRENRERWLVFSRRTAPGTDSSAEETPGN